MTKQPVRNQFRAEDMDEARALVAATRIEYVLCAARGHKWPDLDPRRALPKGFVLGPVRRDGLYDVTEHCGRCPETRWYLSRPSDIFGRGITRTYRPPKDRPVIARGISRQVWGDELSDQLSAKIVAAGRRATEAADLAAETLAANGHNPVGSVA